MSDGPEKPPEFPRWCDPSCPHAAFPDEAGLDGSGSCRTFLALWCRHLREIVTRNAPCEAARRLLRRGSGPG